MLFSIRCVNAGHGVPLALTPGVRTPASWVSVQADVNNVGVVYVGGVVDSAGVKAVAVKNSVDNSGLYVGHAIAPGDTVPFSELYGATYLDLQYIYFDADNTFDSITVNYGRR
jgi:hypothetical protein